MRVCQSFEIKTPTNKQIINLLKLLLPEISVNKKLIDNITYYIQGDLRKLENIINIYQ